MQDMCWGSKARGWVGALALVGAAAVQAAPVAAGASTEGVRLNVVSSGGFAAAFRALAAREQAQGRPVNLLWGPSMGQTHDAIPARLQRGEPIDVVIMVGGALDRLMAQGQLVPGSKVVLADSRIACAVAAGAPHPDLSTVAKVREALLAAPSVAWSDSASGEYIQGQLLDRLGIAAEVKAKGRQIPATPVGEIVARHEVALGCQQRSELQPVAGIDIVADLPDEIQHVTPYAAAIAKGSAHTEQARAFIRALAAPESAPLIAATGLQPKAR